MITHDYKRIVSLLMFFTLTLVCTIQALPIHKKITATPKHSLMAANVPDKKSDQQYIPVPDNLILENVSNIPKSIEDSVNRYANFRTALLQDWHPTRREILITTRFGETPQIHKVQFPGGDRTQVTFLADEITNARYISGTNKSDHLIFTKDTNGNGLAQHYRFDFETGEIVLLTDGKTKNFDPILSSSGSLMVYGSNRRNGNDCDLYILNPLQPQTHRLLTELSGPYWEPLDISNDDKKVLVMEYISIDEMPLWIIDVNSGKKQKVTNKDGSNWSGMFSGDGKGIYVLTNRDSDYVRLAYIDLSTGKHEYLTANNNWDIEEFKVSPDEKNIAYVVNEEGSSRLYILNTQTKKIRGVNGLSLGVISNLRWHSTSTDLGFSYENAKSPKDIYSINIKSNKIERWTRSETSGLNAETFSDARLIKWKSFDEKVISGFIVKPGTKFTGKRPILIYLHGGPELQSRPYFTGRYNYLTNELGMAVIYPNVRGSSGFGQQFMHLDDTIKREGAIKDIGALLDWIKTQPSLDANKIVVMGDSYGGYLSLMSAVSYGDKIKGVVTVAGITNLITLIQNSEDWVRELVRQEYGDEQKQEVRAVMERMSPALNAVRIKAPMLVVAGKEDTVVPFSEADLLVSAAKKNEIPVWYLVAKDEGHGFVKKKNRDFMFYTFVHFLKQNLLN